MIKEHVTRFGFLNIYHINNEDHFYPQTCNPDTRHVTVGDLRQFMKGKPQPQQPPPPPPVQPTIEYQPTYKDPPLNPISPGGGMMRKSMRVTFDR